MDATFLSTSCTLTVEMFSSDLIYPICTIAYLLMTSRGLLNRKTVFLEFPGAFATWLAGTAIRECDNSHFMTCVL